MVRPVVTWLVEIVSALFAPYTKWSKLPSQASTSSILMLASPSSARSRAFLKARRFMYGCMNGPHMKHGNTGNIKVKVSKRLNLIRTLFIKIVPPPKSDL